MVCPYKTQYWLVIWLTGNISCPVCSLCDKTNFDFYFEAIIEFIDQECLLKVEGVGAIKYMLNGYDIDQVDGKSFS